ncbi:MAG: DUF1513 domain-containing protein [Pseudomonadota bacterium]
MPTRRAFVAAASAAGLAPSLGWADVGSPRYLAAARLAEGRYALFGLDASGRDLFGLALPERGHAAAVHPDAAIAVAFARRPGRFALVIDCAAGVVRRRLEAPEGRHFYGHGTFSRDGALLMTTENDYEAGEGRIGIWSVAEGYQRLGEVPSGGIGPHDLVRLPGSDILVVANGGILTHPDTGRAKLNLPTMAPTLTYLSLADGVLEQVSLPAAYRLNSIRHLAVRPDGLVAAAMQWQGALTDIPPLLALHRLGGGAPVLLAAEAQEQRATRGYAGSVAFSGDGAQVAFTAPRGGRLHAFDLRSRRLVRRVERPDICGVAAAPTGFFATDGLGGTILIPMGEAPIAEDTSSARAWDNHLIAL